MRVSFNAIATRQLSDLHAYLNERNPSAAASVVQRIQDCCRRLESHPFMGRATERANLRMLPVAGYPYLILYRIFPARDEVRVTSIRHGARRHPGFQEPVRTFAA